MNELSGVLGIAGLALVWVGWNDGGLKYSSGRVIFGVGVGLTMIAIGYLFA